MLSKVFFYRLLLSLLLLVGFMSLTACNTIAGVGEDIEEAGEAIEQEAEEEERY